MSLLNTLKRLFGMSGAPSPRPGDRVLICADCKKEFIFDVGEQRFFKAKGFTDPKRCPECRKKIRGDMRKKHRTRRGGRQRFGRKDSIIDGNSPYADAR